MGLMRGLVLALALALAACTPSPQAGHSLAWFPRGVCPGGVRAEALGFTPERASAWRPGTPLPLQEVPADYAEGEALPPWRWRGAARVAVAGPGEGRYRFTCLPEGLGSLEVALAWGPGEEVALLVLEDPRAPAGLRVGIRRW